MPTDADVLDLQKRLIAVERLLRAGIPTNVVSPDLNKTTTWTGTTTDLTVGTIVTWTGTAWEAADQDALNPEDQIGVVISQSSTRITVVLWGNFILDPATVTDQTAYYLDPDNPGEFTDTPADTLVFRCAENGECFIATAGGAGGADPSVIVTLTGNFTTFTVGKVLRFNGTSWELAAIGSIVSDKELFGVVTEHSTTETKVCIWGVCVVAGVTDNSTYYLSETTAGTATLTVGSFPVFKVSNGQVFIERTSPVIGDSTSGGGRLTVYTDPSKKVQVLQTGHLQATRSTVVFDYTHVNTITDDPTAPTGPGVKGQMHMIY